ncbi:MAG: carbon-phosphorus lyase complex subunit PhnI [Thermincolia bacterium]
MAYVAVKGGTEAIAAAAQMVEYFRLKGESAPLEIAQIREQMRLAVDKVMGEGSLYAPDHAAIALKQSEGDSIEASFILRAYRSTLPRDHDSLPVDTRQMRVIRRISAAFKDIPGGQILGPTRDYTQRMLEFNLLEEGEEHRKEFLTSYLPKDLSELPPLVSFPKVLDLLRSENLLLDPNSSKQPKEPIDITREALVFPAHRSARLQSLARGETGGMLALAYSSMRGYGSIHPTLGELRVGYVPLVVAKPYNPAETVVAGEVLITEAEVVSWVQPAGEERPRFTIGYGLCFGQNELKAISMAVLDRTMQVERPHAPCEDEEFVLSHIDGIESSGFTAHWKLPHYVDFQSELNRVRSVKQRKEGVGVEGE